MTFDPLLHQQVTAPQLIAAWLWLNLVPFSVIGILLIVVANALERAPASQRLAFAVLIAALVVSTGCSTVIVVHRAAVVYDYCTDPNMPGWLWWLTCLLK